MRSFAATTLILGAVAVASAGALAHQGQQAHEHPQSGKSDQAQQNGEFDLRFLDMTAMHHEMGVEMSELAQQKAESAQLKAKAAEMAQAQQRDIAEVEQLRSTLYPNAAKRQGMSEMHGHMGGTGTSGQGGAGHQHEGQSQGRAAGQKGGMMGGDMKGMMAEMNRLQKLTGAEFDQAFAKQMIRHHQMHIQMSQRATKDAKHDEVRQFAEKSIAEQKKDISELEKFAGAAK